MGNTNKAYDKAECVRQRPSVILGSVKQTNKTSPAEISSTGLVLVSYRNSIMLYQSSKMVVNQK